MKTSLRFKKQQCIVLLRFCIAALFIISTGTICAQCSAPLPGSQAPLISSFHTSMLTASNGDIYIWGEGSSGTGSFLYPTLIANNNIGTYTGKPRIATVGSRAISTANLFMITTDPVTPANGKLYVWGRAGWVVPLAVFGPTLNTTYQAQVIALPAGINADDVKKIDASAFVLAILTYSGDVYIMANNALSTSGSTYGDGSATKDNAWHRTKINAGTFLTGVTDIVVSYGCCMAAIAGGQFYAWGSADATAATGTYLGNGAASAIQLFAASMTSPLPGGVTVRQIDMTNSTNLGHSYYVLGSNNILYTMGFNNMSQLGNGNTTTQTSWVTAGNGVFSNNVLSMSANNHDYQYAAAAVITTAQGMYAWGENNGGLFGGVGTGANNPVTPNGFVQGTDLAALVEVGGHTLAFQKAGNRRLCYEGHSTSGSMGDGLSAGFNRTTADCANGGSLPPFGCNTGEDHGDAPASYGDASAQFLYDYNTSLAGNQELKTGTNYPDAENAGIVLVAAGANNNSGAGDGATNYDDEDGVTIPPIPNSGATSQTIINYSVTVNVTNTIGATANVVGWIDWNNDGVFTASEGIAATVATGASGTSVILTWPSSVLTAAAGTAGLYARFRISTDAALTTAFFTGNTTNGEVEDYKIPFANVVPVRLESFTGTMANCFALLQWKTTSEINSSYYEVQVSTNGINYSALAKLTSKSSSTGSSYTYVVKSMAGGSNYFRLRMADGDGSSRYSNVTALRNDCGGLISAEPNPAKDIVIVAGLSGRNSIYILDITGKILSHKISTDPAEQFNVAAYAPGTYVIRIINNDGHTTNLKLVKEK